MNKRLLNIAKYLSKNDLYEEASKIKKIAQEQQGFAQDGSRRRVRGVPMKVIRVLRRLAALDEHSFYYKLKDLEEYIEFRRLAALPVEQRSRLFTDPWDYEKLLKRKEEYTPVGSILAEAGYPLKDWNDEDLDILLESMRHPAVMEYHRQEASEVARSRERGGSIREDWDRAPADDERRAEENLWNQAVRRSK